MRIATIIAAALALSTQAANAATIVNGSFETPSVGIGNWIAAPTGTDFSFAGPAGLAANGAQFEGAAPDGVQAAYFYSGGRVGLQVTGLIQGMTYTTSFFAAAISQSNQSLISSVIIDDGNSVGLGPVNLINSAFIPIKTGRFRAKSSEATLVFYGLGGGGAAIDMVSISDPSAVPEPATWALMIIGFGAVGAAMRARARRSCFQPSPACS